MHCTGFIYINLCNAQLFKTTSICSMLFYINFPQYTIRVSNSLDLDQTRKIFAKQLGSRSGRTKLCQTVWIQIRLNIFVKQFGSRSGSTLLSNSLYPDQAWHFCRTVWIQIRLNIIVKQFVSRSGLAFLSNSLDPDQARLFGSRKSQCCYINVKLRS